PHTFTLPLHDALPISAFSAAVLRPAAPFVRTALRALAERARGPRARDAARAWRERACGDAAARPSRFSAARTARPRLGFGFRPARRVALAADARVSSLTRPRGGVGSFTPARRAFDSPMAIACFV